MGTGVPLGLLLIGTIIYIIHLRRRQRSKNHRKSIQDGGEVNEPAPTVWDGLRMLDASPLQRPYCKPELLETARREITELPAWQVAGLPVVRDDSRSNMIGNGRRSDRHEEGCVYY